MKNNNLKETLSRLLPIVLLLAGITVLGKGISLLVSQSGMRKTDAVISEITEEPYLINGREKQVVSALVTYTLEDTVYTADLGGVRSGFIEGDSLTVLVDPAAPQKVAMPSAAAGVSCTVIGAVLLLAGVIWFIPLLHAVFTAEPKTENRRPVEQEEKKSA